MVFVGCRWQKGHGGEPLSSLALMLMLFLLLPRLVRSRREVAEGWWACSGLLQLRGPPPEGGERGRADPARV